MVWYGYECAVRGLRTLTFRLERTGTREREKGGREGETGVMGIWGCGSVGFGGRGGIEMHGDGWGWTGHFVFFS